MSDTDDFADHKAELIDRVRNAQRNDQNLWMVLGEVT